MMCNLLVLHAILAAADTSRARGCTSFDTDEDEYGGGHVQSLEYQEITCDYSSAQKRSLISSFHYQRDADELHYQCVVLAADMAVNGK